jgi:type IV pilus assembly protein PilE
MRILSAINMSSYRAYGCRLKGIRGRGFTLIELVITVAIVAILAMIAMPSYTEHVRKARRAQAKADLLETAQLLERWYSVNRTYVGFALPFAISPRDAAAGNQDYNIAFPAAATVAAYTLQATPQNAQTADKCGTLTIDNVGRKFHGGIGTDDYCGFGIVGP